MQYDISKGFDTIKFKLFIIFIDKREAFLQLGSVRSYTFRLSYRFRALLFWMVDSQWLTMLKVMLYLNRFRHFVDFETFW